MDTIKIVPNTSPLRKILDVDTPFLEVLSMRHYSPWLFPDTTADIEITRPSNLKHVRSLVLSNCGFDWNQVELSNLTTLNLSCTGSPNLRPSTKQILDMLRRSPRLQTLELISAAWDEADELEIPPLDFSLPHLKRLVLATAHSTSFAKGLANPAVLPELDSISVEISTTDEQEMTHIFLSTSRLVKQRSISVFQVLGNKYNEEGLFAYFQDPQPGDNGTFSFTNTWDRSDLNPIDLPQALLSCLEEFDLNGLEKLDYSLHRPLSEQWCRDLLGRLPALQVLRVECSESPGGIISALMPSDAEVLNGSSRQNPNGMISRSRAHNTGEDSNSQGQSSLLLPSLCQLILADVGLTTSASRRQSMRGAPFENGSLKHLAHCIKLRKQLGSELELLALPGASEDYNMLGLHLDQNVLELVCLDDDGVVEEEGSESGFPEVVVHRDIHGSFDFLY
jgi:hypothetical protein